jgi:hypothetical protein
MSNIIFLISLFALTKFEHYNFILCLLFVLLIVLFNNFRIYSTNEYKFAYNAMSPDCLNRILHSSISPFPIGKAFFLFYSTILARYIEENHLVYMLFYLPAFSNVQYYVLDFFVWFT